jgi:hypothetical protein
MDELKIEQIHAQFIKHVNKVLSYIDALVHYADTHDIEIEVIGEMIRRSPILKSKVRDDAEKLKLVEESKKLPL